MQEHAHHINMLCTTSSSSSACSTYVDVATKSMFWQLVARLKVLLEVAAHPPISPKRWQELANDIIGAENSRKTPMYAYRCVHSSSEQEAGDFCGHNSNCAQKEKRTTLLAYIKKQAWRRHEKKALLPIKSLKQPSEKSRIKIDNENKQCVTKEIKRNRLLKNWSSMMALKRPAA